MMRLSIIPLLALLASPAPASHLGEKEVQALEQECNKQRQAKLLPQRLALVEKCMSEERLSQAACEKKYANYGEIRHGGIRTLGKYYDLPVCQQAHSARKHYKMNPGY